VVTAAGVPLAPACAVCVAYSVSSSALSVGLVLAPPLVEVAGACPAAAVDVLSLLLVPLPHAAARSASDAIATSAPSANHPFDLDAWNLTSPPPTRTAHSHRYMTYAGLGAPDAHAAGGWGNSAMIPMLL
jgi:hypothetical protein